MNNNIVKLRTVKKELSRAEQRDKERKRKLLAKQGIKMAESDEVIRQMQDRVESWSWYLFVCVSLECTQPTTFMNKRRKSLGLELVMRLTTRSWHVGTSAPSLWTIPYTNSDVV
jgi:hypothetical protein